MKKNILSFLLLIIFALNFSGCNDNKKSNTSNNNSSENHEIPENESNPETNVPENDGLKNPFIKGQFYAGNIVQLFKEGDWGFINLKGEDAKTLFDVLATRSYEESPNIILDYSEIKKGKSIICYKTIRKISPQNYHYNCSFAIYAKLGATKQQTIDVLSIIDGYAHTILRASNIDDIPNKFLTDEYLLSGQEDFTIPNLTEPYKSEHLELKYPSSNNLGNVIIQGEDAKALYSSMVDIHPIQDDNDNNTFIKNGSHLKCIEKLNHSNGGKSYYCSLSINYRTGETYELNIDE